MKYPHRFARRLLTLLALALGAVPAFAQDTLEAKPDDPFFAQVQPLRAPAPGPLLLRAGDRLAIVGDSITEQKMYSRILETYLTVCVPELKVTARQYGWSGETAEGFLRRMTNDCLRFQPTVATLCYGMNDFKYRPYDEANARWYEASYSAVVRSFQAVGARVVLGSPGCMGKTASWVKSSAGTVEEQNASLCEFRNIGIGIAARDGLRFADVFWPMYVASFQARQRYGTNYAVAGHDGVHPGWAGHLIMARSFLKALGLDGDLGTITVDLQASRATATGGHRIDSCTGGAVTVTSARYPFCATGDLNSDGSIRSGMTLVPFNEELNRFRLVVQGGGAARYKVAWGQASALYTSEQLARGINLAADFPANPFSAAFQKVDDAVGAKQAYETEQIKHLFRTHQARLDMEAVAEMTEAERAPLAAAIQSAFVPVTHTLRIEPQ